MDGLTVDGWMDSGVNGWMIDGWMYSVLFSLVFSVILVLTKTSEKKNSEDLYKRMFS